MDLPNKIIQMESRISENERQISKLWNAVNDIYNILEKHDDKIKETKDLLDETITGIQEQNTTNEKLFSDMSTRMDDLEAKIP